MELLKDKVFSNFKRISLSKSDIEFLQFVFKENSVDQRLIVECNKIYSGFLYSIYQVNFNDKGNNYSAFIKSSPHKSFFAKEKNINSYCNKNNIIPNFPLIKKTGKYLGEIEYIFFITKNSFLSSDILTDNIPLFSKKLSLINQYFYKNFNSLSLKKLPSTIESAKLFFDFSSFHEYVSERQKRAFIKKYDKIKENVFFSFYKDAFKYFQINILPHLDKNADQICLGYKSPEDIIVLKNSYCPNFISFNSIYRGDPCLDMIFNCFCLDISELDYINCFGDEYEEVLSRFRKVYDFCWIFRLNLIYFNKLLTEFYSYPAHNFSFIKAEQIYYECRARMKRSDIFSKYVESFNDFFIEK